jgi:hypothetical protein
MSNEVTILEEMILRSLQHKADDFDLEYRPAIPPFHEIQEKLDTPEGQSLADFMGHMWEAVDEWVFDNFPTFRYDDRDPIDRYGTPEHEAWLIEMERQEG